MPEMMMMMSAGGGGGGGGGGTGSDCGGTEEPGICSGCGDKITDRYYLLAVEKQWHVTCLVCVICKLPLDSEVTCFAKDGDIFCKDDYYRRFVLKCCAHCQLSIGADELVMRVRDHIYHLNCFTCAACGKQLTTGEHFGLSDNMIFCQLHYESLLHGEFLYHRNIVTGSQSAGGFGDHPGANPGGLLPPPPTPSLGSYFHQGSGPAGHATLQKGRPRKRKAAMSDAEHFVPALGSEMTNLGHDEIMLQHPRQKRMRTSFKHHQLRIMKSYFALNHNPDSKDLKQLAQKTGLSKRVLQVWFQNARAKHRRTAMKERDKQQQQPGSDNGGSGSAGGGGGSGGGMGVMSGGGGSTGGMLDVQSMTSGAMHRKASLLNELSNSGSPGALSDISSSTSLMGLRTSSSLDQDLVATPHGSHHGLADIFGTTLRGH